MRLREFADSSKNSIEGTVAGILNFLRNRAHDYKIPLEINTNELISMVQKTGIPFSYDSLVQINKDPAMQNLIASIDRDKVKIRPFGDESGEEKGKKIVNKTDQEKKDDKIAQAKAELDTMGPAGKPGQEQGQEVVQNIDDVERARKANQVNTMAKRAMNRRR